MSKKKREWVRERLILNGQMKWTENETEKESERVRWNIMMAVFSGNAGRLM